MYNVNPLRVAGALGRNRPQGRGRRRAGVGEEFQRSSWCQSTNSYYDPLRETCPPPSVGRPGISNIAHPGGGWNTLDHYGPPPGGAGGSGSGGGSPFLCPDGSYSDGPEYCPSTGGGGGGGSGGPVSTPGGGGGGGGGGSGGPVSTPGGGGGGYGGPGGCNIPQTCAPPLVVCPENQKRYIMPFIPNAGFTASVTAGSTVEFVGRPQKLFKPDRLIVASTIAPFFNIVSLLIANIPQSLSSGAVAADIYSEVATNMEMSFDQAYPGIDVILTAVNKSSVTQTFQVQLAGWAVG